MFDETVTVNEDLLTDYLFGQLGLDGRIRVEFALSKDPELAAKVAGCKAKMLAIKRLAESSLFRDVPSSIIDILKPLLDDQRLALHPEQMARWLADGSPMQKPNGHGGNGAFLHESE